MVVSLRVLVTPGEGLVASGAGLCMGISPTFIILMFVISIQTINILMLATHNFYTNSIYMTLIKLSFPIITNADY